MSKSPLQQTVISHDRHFSGHPQEDTIRAMLDAANKGIDITSGWYNKAHANGGKDAEAILGVEVKNENTSGSGHEDVLTIADRECEEAMIPILTAAVDIPVVGEETSPEALNADVPEGSQRWLIDPIDGTFCFKNGYPDFSITLALQTKVDDEWKTELGLIANPLHNEIYFADDKEAFLIHGERAKPLSVATDETIPNSLNDILKNKRIEVTAYSPDPDNKVLQHIRPNLKKRLGDSAQITYSTAIMVAKMAEDWVDGAVIGGEALAYAWDLDAAIHIAEKAGIKTKRMEIDGAPYLFLANSQPLLTALEHVTKQEIGKIKTQFQGASRAA